MPKKLLLVASVSLSIVITLFFLSIWIYLRWQITRPIVPAQLDTYTFVVQDGVTTGQVLDDLETQGFIDNASVVTFYLKFHDIVGTVQSGEYILQEGLSVQQVLESLQGGSFQQQLTFLEGWRREEYAAYLAKEKGDEYAQEFYRASADLEGQLFPDTYFVDSQTTVQDLVTLLHQTFLEKSEQANLLVGYEGFTQDQLLILASIIEREVQIDADRAIVAGILMKRIQSEWRLDTDATLQYALANLNAQKDGVEESVLNPDFDWWPQVLTIDDLAVESPYNTRQITGLPPTPISNPGLSALEAVTHPLASEYWFYLTDSEGITRYATTLEEHNQNIAQFGISQ